ncbi:spore coat protein [Cohnella sp. CFH 77786]|uniref:spore coat protein n=1 Tax=Cohnella sp. CFH 77786 TaxID=2662265 RepID=UPI001C60F781|nr:spore coat protein [Cohnella sp. CFH 77786]MBW5446315.1 spore coat protein [Cohnella sp. CFH 77786]
MNSMIEKLFGVHTLTDQVIATDLLQSAKSGVLLYAVAATEAVTPEVKATFVRQLFEAVDSHEKIANYMMRKGYYQPYAIREQIWLDRSNARTALEIPS